MKKINKFLLFTIGLTAIMLLVLACSDDLDVKQNYGFSVETLPLPKSLAKGETVALEFSIVREGHYEGTVYKFRYFQGEGTGTLTDAKGKSIPMNRFHNIASDDFVLTYTSLAEEQSQLDFVFEDNFGKRVEYTVTFTGKKTVKEKE